MFLKKGFEIIISKGPNVVRVIEVELFSDFNRPIPRTGVVNATLVICLPIIFEVVFRCLDPNPPPGNRPVLNGAKRDKARWSAAGKSSSRRFF